MASGYAVPMTLASALSDFFTTNVDPADALPSRYNYGLVLVSYLVASLASYTFLQFAGRIVELGQSVARYAWLAAGAVMMGVGIWAMHFVGMLAYVLPIPVAYEIVPTALSVAPAVLAAAVALSIVARPAVSTRRLLIGGTLMGAGIGAMHYGGMEAMSVSALVRYDPTLFATSIVAAVVLSILALQVRFWVGTSRVPKSGTPSASTKSGAVREIVSALILGFAVTAMHYIAMASTYCFANKGSDLLFFLDARLFAGVTTVIASLVLLLAIAAVGFDRRMKAEIAMRRQADANVAAEMERLNSVFQSTGAGIVLLDRDGRVILANQHVLDDFGKTASEVVGQTIPSSASRHLLRCSTVGSRAAGPERLKAIEYERNLVQPNGSKRVIKVTVDPVQDQAGRLRYIVLIAVDDTDRREAEVRLFDTARIAHLGDMATGMAHELNQPLAVIRMSTEGLLEELDMPEAEAMPADMIDLFRGKLDKICKQVERATGLVKTLRSVAHKPADNPRRSTWWRRCARAPTSCASS